MDIEIKEITDNTTYFKKIINFLKEKRFEIIIKYEDNDNFKIIKRLNSDFIWLNKMLVNAYCYLPIPDINNYYHYNTQIEYYKYLLLYYNSNSIISGSEYYNNFINLPEKEFYNYKNSIITDKNLNFIENNITAITLSYLKDDIKSKYSYLLKPEITNDAKKLSDYKSFLKYYITKLQKIDYLETENIKNYYNYKENIKYFTNKKQKNQLLKNNNSNISYNVDEYNQLLFKLEIYINCFKHGEELLNNLYNIELYNSKFTDNIEKKILLKGTKDNIKNKIITFNKYYEGNTSNDIIDIEKIFHNFIKKIELFL